MSYHQADRVGGTSLKTLLVRNLGEGNSLAGSAKLALSDKFTARMTRIKRRFDPLNIVRMFTGQLGAAVVGRMIGRSGQDIKYFGGQRSNSIIHHYLHKGLKDDDDEDRPKTASRVDPLHTTLSAGQHQKLRKGDGLADILTKTYILIQTNHEADIKRFELERLTKEEQEKERERWNSNLVKALMGDKKKPIRNIDSKSSGVLGAIGKVIGVFTGMIEGLLAGVLGILEMVGHAILGVIQWLGNFKWIEALKWVKDLKNMQSLKWVAGFVSVEALGLGIIAEISRRIINKDSSEKERIANLGGPEANKLYDEFRQGGWNGGEIAKHSKLNEGTGFDTTLGNKAAEYKKKLPALIEKKQKVVEQIMTEAGYKKSRVDSDGMYHFIDPKTNKEVSEQAYNFASEKADERLNAEKLKPVEKDEKGLDQLMQDETGPDIREMPIDFGNTEKEDWKPINIYDQAQKAYGPIDSVKDIDKRLQDGTKKLNDAGDSANPTPVLINNSKVIGAKANDGPSLSMDSTVPVRTDDPTLRKVLKQSTRWA